MTQTQEITREQAQAAYETLKAFGLQAFREEHRSETPEGQQIGTAIAKVTDYDFDVCFEAAGALCEEVNMHDEALIIREGFAAYRAKYPAQTAEQLLQGDTCECPEGREEACIHDLAVTVIVPAEGV